ncbi:MAG: N-acetyl-gamma-glutamyl-phosphate reductase [Candidatus Brocadiae bacterium]|nr:N-acetyl-gamma-glutamyl-phosphate reductase [Candidatus Brocadiia bacterium]
MVRVGIIGSTGSVGEALIRVLLGHPGAELAFLGSDHAAGEPVATVLPALRGQTDAACRAPDLDALAAETDVVFLAKKGPDSMEWAPKLVDAGLKVIDCGGEFRFRDVAVYEQFYGDTHTCPALLAEAVYGLPELYREALAGARIVGTPGCYPASAILPLVPLLRAGLVAPEAIVVDSYSGLSGAGKQYSAKGRNLFLECDANCRAYAPLTHRHAPEIEQELSLAAGRDASVLFVPHLLPLDRGILTCIFATLARPATADDVMAVWREAYADEPFIRLVDDLGDVELRHVRRTNYCDFAAVVDPRTQRVVISSALDNVIKGAVGSAVQSMNVLCGIPETTGLLHRCV